MLSDATLGAHAREFLISKLDIMATGYPEGEPQAEFYMAVLRSLNLLDTAVPPTQEIAVNVGDLKPPQRWRCTHFTPQLFQDIRHGLGGDAVFYIFGQKAAMEYRSLLCTPLMAIPYFFGLPAHVVDRSELETSYHNLPKNGFLALAESDFVVGELI